MNLSPLQCQKGILENIITIDYKYNDYDYN